MLLYKLSSLIYTKTALTLTVHCLGVFITGVGREGGGGGRDGASCSQGLISRFFWYVTVYVVDCPNTKEYLGSIVCCTCTQSFMYLKEQFSCVSSQSSSEAFLGCIITVTIQLRQK